MNNLEEVARRRGVEEVVVRKLNQRKVKVVDQVVDLEVARVVIEVRQKDQVEDLHQVKNRLRNQRRKLLLRKELKERKLLQRKHQQRKQLVRYQLRKERKLPRKV